MKINLLCSDRYIPKDLFQHHAQETWAGIDRGALILIQNQIDPVFSVGDFDSVNNQERQLLATQLNIHPVKAEKDDTDLGLGVAQAVEEGYQDIHIYGATGGRLDHFMGVIQILLKSEYINKGIKFKIIDEQNEIILLTSGMHNISPHAQYQYVSFIPVSGEPVLTLAGFKYNLEKEKLVRGSTLTISNEVEKPNAKIEIHNGLVLQIRSKDL